MAVIITNMDIPMSCAVCKFEREAGKAKYCRLTLSNTELGGRIRLFNCPLKSADEMIAEITRELEKLREINTAMNKETNCYANPEIINMSGMIGGYVNTLSIIHKYCDKEKNNG